MWVEAETPDASIGQALNAAAYMVSEPAEQLSGYVIIAIMKDQNYKVTSNACCPQHTNALLADVLLTYLNEPSPGCPRGG